MAKKRAKTKIWRVKSRNAYNDSTLMWTADEAKARAEFDQCLERYAMNLSKDGITFNFYCYVGGFEVYETNNGLAEFNAAHGTDCKDWKDAARVAGGFTGEDNCASSEASIESFDGEVLPDGTAVVYMPVQLQ